MTSKRGFYREDIAADLHSAYATLKSLHASNTDALADRLRTYAYGIEDGYDLATKADIAGANQERRERGIQDG